MQILKNITGLKITQLARGIQIAIFKFCTENLKLGRPKNEILLVDSGIKLGTTGLRVLGADHSATLI